MLASNNNTMGSMLDSTINPPLHSLEALKDLPTSNSKPVVVGLYGVPGSGKTFLLNQLKHELNEEHFAFYEGSEKIGDLIPGGLDAFHKLEESEKVYWRKLAIDTIGKESTSSGRVAIVTGHFMLWPEEEKAGRSVYTQNDLDTYTHILYLDVPDEVVLQRRLSDTNRNRPSISPTHLSKWQQAEKSQLYHLCHNHGILFSLVSLQPTMLSKVLTLLRDFQHHTEQQNLALAERMLEQSIGTNQDQLETVLVMDADKTLAAVDTGMLFWERTSSSWRWADNGHPLKSLFSSSMGYSYTAFRQATLLYEEAANDQEFDAICQDVASTVIMHPEFVSLLRLATETKHVGAVIVTCGLRRVWQKVLAREGLSETVKIIGGGRIADGFVITATVKAAIVGRLQDTYQAYVWAFGDSPLDIEMLSKADQAIVVVGDEQTRSKSMDEALMKAVDNDGLRAYQTLLPSHGPPRLDTTRLPLLQLTERKFLESILCRRAGIQVQHATNRDAAKLLMTPMRDANVVGPALREAHRRVGQYLANEFLPSVIGLEEHSIPHVQGHSTMGHRLLHEKSTTIVALMRGGEPMAFGVNDVYPLAMFVHASSPEDIKPHHLQGQSTILLVDSVVNNGRTVVQFEQNIRKLHASIRIVVVTGVIQTGSISRGGLIYGLTRNTKLDLVALRLSENKYTGKGTTDTGNRLFNTTHMP